jgi:tetratricopeptide (TPR) repeat protein
MSAASDAVLRELEALGESEVLDVPERHSAHQTPGEEESASAAAPGLGRRELKAFRGLHVRALAALEARLARARGADELAVRGRVRRLRGDVAGARKDLLAARRLAPKDARALAWLGELDVLSAPKAAAKLLGEALELDPEHARARLWRGQARLEARSFRLARRELDQAAALFGRPPHALLLLRALAAYHCGERAAAAADCEAAIADDPGSPAAYALLSRLRHEEGKEEEALALCHLARDRDPDVGASYLLPGVGKETWSDARRYLALLDRQIERHPRSPLLRAERAELKRDPRICQYAGALEDYAAAAALAPKAAWIQALPGRALNNMHGAKAGLAEFDRAAALEPGSGWIRAWRGAALARAGETGRALEDFAEAARLMPWYPFTYAWRGALYVRQGRHAEAAADLDVAVALDPHYVFSRYERCKARLGLGEYEGAMEDLAVSFKTDPKYAWPPAFPLAKAVAARPDLGWVQAWRGWSLMKEGQGEAARAALDAAVKALPREAAPLSWRGACLAGLGLGAQARRDLERAVRLEPRSWSAHKALGDLLAAQGRTGEALKRLRKVTELAPTTVSHLMDLARLALRAGRAGEALGALGRALELDASYAQARALAAQAHFAAGDHAAAEREAEAALKDPHPPGLAHLVRGTLRGARGDEAGQAEDFRRALELDPGLFDDAQRRELEALLRSGRAA